MSEAKMKPQWSVDKTSGLICSYDFTHDVMLEVSGDFETNDQRAEYISDLCRKLNTRTGVSREKLLEFILEWQSTTGTYTGMDELKKAIESGELDE